VIANVVEASWIKSTGMAVVFAAPRGGLPEPRRAMEVSRPPAKRLGIISRARLPADLGQGSLELFDGAIQEGWFSCH
jgi:hypothetical protein